jgi:transposase
MREQEHGGIAQVYAGVPDHPDYMLRVCVDRVAGDVGVRGLLDRQPVAPIPADCVANNARCGGAQHLNAVKRIVSNEVAHGIINYVVDSSSIEVNRRARRAKTDRLDLAGLLSLLARYVLGDRRAWRVVRVPTVAEEDARHLPRTLEASTQDRTRLMNRLKSLLATQGVSVAIDAPFLNRLEAAHLWDGAPLPPGLQERLTRTWTQLQEVDGQIRGLKTLRLTRPEMLTPATSRALAQLLTMRAIGPIGASVLATEIFGWRRIRNGRELAVLVGLVPAPYQSGETDYDQGITRAGNAHVRRVIVQLAWGWIRHQPVSALTHWFQRRFGAGGKRLKKIGIVALARKLLIALWRYLETGVVPGGARLKPMEV